MSLDLTKIIGQVSNMVTRLKSRSRERNERLHNAVTTLHSQNQHLDDLKKKIERSENKTTWLVAKPVDTLTRRHQAPVVPSEFTVIATDGSHMDVDRHRSTRCYLINIGCVMLKYGAEPEALLNNYPQLCADDEDLVMSPPGATGREQLIEGDLLGIKRGVDECRYLTQMAEELPENTVALALLDGSLLMWSLEAYPDFVKGILLDKGYLAYLERIRNLNQSKNIALASYISFPRSTDVVNVLRIALCPEDVVDSDRCSGCTERKCEMVAGIRDRDLYLNILEPGERSDLFISSSKIQRYYGVHLVHFFYIRLNDEIARVEIPGWVANNEKLLDITHALILDQCQKGQGYPVVLSEAHEKAVITGVDRENFWQIVESALVDEHLPSTGSAKDRSKRTRWL